MVDHPLEKTNLMTLEDLVRLFEDEGPFELINGERVALNPMVMKHNIRAKRLYDALVRFLLDKSLGEAYFEAAFVLTYQSDWVTGSRVPDILFVRAERLAAYITAHPNWEDMPLVLVPDLAVEVISTNDHYSDVDAKVDLYLDDGVEIIWVVDPKQKTVTVRGRDYYKKLKVGDVLTGGDVIPGFELAVEKIFE
jgi:Uma2 family endonuclease